MEKKQAKHSSPVFRLSTALFGWHTHSVGCTGGVHLAEHALLPLPYPGHGGTELVQVGGLPRRRACRESSTCMALQWCGYSLQKPSLFVHFTVAHYLYYVNFACDVLVYAFSSANFRRTVLIAWRRLLCPGWARDNKDTPTRCTNGTLAYQQSMRRLLPHSPSQHQKVQQASNGQQQRNHRVSLEVDGEEARRSLAQRCATK